MLRDEFVCLFGVVELSTPVWESDKRRKITVRLTTGHSASSYGQPVIVLPDGGALDLMSWVGCGYRVERTTARPGRGALG